MNRYCWEPGSYTASSFACVPTGDPELMLQYIDPIYSIIYDFFCINIYTYNNFTAKNRK